VKKDDGSFRESKFVVREMPSCLFFRRNEKFQIAQWLTEGTVNWGNHGKVIDELGIRGSRSVMLAAVRLLYYLGFRIIYLLGVDLKMASDQQNYVFKQYRHGSSVKGNNASYEALIRRFEALQPLFKKAGLRLFNCNPDSGLKVFPYVPYEEALQETAKECSKVVDTEGWYDHDKTMKGRLDEGE